MTSVESLLCHLPGKVEALFALSCVVLLLSSLVILVQIGVTVDPHHADPCNHWPTTDITYGSCSLVTTQPRCGFYSRVTLERTSGRTILDNDLRACTLLLCACSLTTVLSLLLISGIVRRFFHEKPLSEWIESSLLRGFAYLSVNLILISSFVVVATTTSGYLFVCDALDYVSSLLSSAQFSCVARNNDTSTTTCPPLRRLPPCGEFSADCVFGRIRIAMAFAWVLLLSAVVANVCVFYRLWTSTHVDQKPTSSNSNKNLENFAHCSSNYPQNATRDISQFVLSPTFCSEMNSPTESGGLMVPAARRSLPFPAPSLTPPPSSGPREIVLSPTIIGVSLQENIAEENVMNT